MKEKATITGVILLGTILLIISPFLSFVLGYFTGWLITLVFAPTFVNGLALFGINLTVDQVPLFCGALGVISSFFKTSSYDFKSRY